MAGPFGTLITSNVKTWMSAKGFILVCLAAMIPLILSVAWVGTHRADVAPSGVTWEPSTPLWGDTVEFSATIRNEGRFSVGAFNASIIVGPTGVLGEQRQIDVRAQNTTRIPGLAPGETATIRMTWTPRAFTPFGAPPDAGTYEVLVDADSQDEIGEIDEFNNRNETNIQIQVGTVSDQAASLPTGTVLTGDRNATTRADVGVRNVTWTPRAVFPNETITISAEFQNLGNASVNGAEATLRVAQFQSAIALNQTSQNLTLGPGEVQTLQFTWKVPALANQFEPELYRVDAFVRAPDSVNDTVAENNVESHAFVLDRKIIFPEPPERATIRSYYISVVRQLLLPLLLPVIGLYYAAGVLSDERDRGNLTYLLTRPINRVALPFARFLVSFFIAGLAITIGTVGSFLLILGLPSEGKGEMSYLVAPLFLVLVALLAYGAVFTLIGVTFSRPYLVGIGFVGWEWLIQVGRQILVNDRPVVAPWVQNLTVFKWLEVLTNEWTVDKALVALPTAGPAMEAMRNLLIATVAVLVLAGYIARRREFPE